MKAREVFWGVISISYSVLVGANLYSLLISPVQGFSLWTLGALMFFGFAAFSVSELRRMYPKDKDFE